MAEERERWADDRRHEEICRTAFKRCPLSPSEQQLVEGFYDTVRLLVTVRDSYTLGMRDPDRAVARGARADRERLDSTLSVCLERMTGLAHLRAALHHHELVELGVLVRVIERLLAARRLKPELFDRVGLEVFLEADEHQVDIDVDRLRLLVADPDIWDRASPARGKAGLRDAAVLIVERLKFNNVKDRKIREGLRLLNDADGRDTARRSRRSAAAATRSGKLAPGRASKKPKKP